MPQCEQTLSPQIYGEIISTSDVSIFDGNLTCISVPPNSSLNDVLAAIDAYVCGITVELPPFDDTDINYTGQTNFGCFNFVNVNNLQDAIEFLANELCSQVGQTYDAADITYSGEVDFSCFSFAGVLTVEDAIEYLANEICNQSPIGALCIDDITLCNLNPDLLFCAFGSLAPTELDPPNDHLGSLLALMIDKICDFNSFAVSGGGVSALGAPNGGDTGSASEFLAASRDYRDVFAAMTRGYEAASGYSFAYASGGKASYSGLSLDVDIDNGSGGNAKYVVNGWKVDRIPYTATMVASSDNYLDVKTDGTYTVTTVALAAPEPAVAGDAMRLWKFTTDGVGVVAAEDRINKFAVSGDTVADDAIVTRHILDANVTNAKLDDIIAADTIGDTDIISFTYNAKGRLTAASHKFNITGLSDLQVLQYQSGSDRWVNVDIAGGILPSATVHQSLRYDGSGQYLASSMILNTNTEVGIGIDNGLPTQALTLGASRSFVHNLARPLGVSASPTGGGSLPANTYYYAIVAVDAYGGITVLSDEVSASVDGAVTTAIDLLWTKSPMYASYTIYRGTVSGTYTERQTGITIDSFTDDSTGWVATANPTHTDTTAYSYRLDDEGFRIGATADENAIVSAANVNGDKAKVAAFIQLISEDIGADTYAIEAQNNSADTSDDNIAVYASATNGGAGEAYAYYAAAGKTILLDSVLVGDLGAAIPDASAIIEFQSNTKGVLMPRMTAVQGSAITPTDGLIIYTTDTDATFTSIGFWGYENGAWTKL